MPPANCRIHALQALAAQHLKTGCAAIAGNPKAAAVCTALPIAEDHAAFAGHFPGFPILPGAALLDVALHEIGRARSIDLTQWSVASTKFLATVRPGDALTLEHSASGDATIRFVIAPRPARSPPHADGHLRAGRRRP